MTMKLRNRLIALACLIVFLSVGALIFVSTSTRKPFAVILFAADNITPSALTAGRLYTGGGDARLQLEEFPNTALCRNAATDFSVPESASASTQIAGGKRVRRNSLCIDDSGAKLKSLLEEAAESGRSTGLISSGSVTGSTAAAFYAKSPSADDVPEIARQFSTHAPFDFVAGGGAGDFDKQETLDSENTKDSAKVTPLLPKGVTPLRSVSEIENQPFWKHVPILGLLAQGPLYEATTVQSTASLLPDLVRIAIKNLQTNRRGYLLVVDDPSIAAAAAANDGETMLSRLLAFDQAVSTARHYAGANALIVITGRENIGGFQLNGFPFLRDKGVAILALNNQGYPSLCWATGPGYSNEGTSETPRGKKQGAANTSPMGILTQPSAYSSQKAVGSGGDVLSLGIGQGSEKIHGFLNLTDLHDIVREAL